MILETRALVVASPQRVSYVFYDSFDWFEIYGKFRNGVVLLL